MSESVQMIPGLLIGGGLLIVLIFLGSAYSRRQKERLQRWHAEDMANVNKWLSEQGKNKRP